MAFPVTKYYFKFRKTSISRIFQSDRDFNKDDTEILRLHGLLKRNLSKSKKIFGILKIIKAREFSFYNE